MGELLQFYSNGDGVRHSLKNPLKLTRFSSKIPRKRLEARVGIGPDPPPGVLEAGCLRRAWSRFQARVSRLKEAFGLLIPSVISGAAALWQQMRLAKKTLAGILGFLAQSCNISLLGDYRCLRAP